MISLDHGQFALLMDDRELARYRCRESVVNTADDYKGPSGKFTVAMGTGYVKQTKKLCNKVASLWPEFNYELGQKNLYIHSIGDGEDLHAMAMTHAAMGIVRGHESGYLPVALSELALELLFALGPPRNPRHHNGCLQFISWEYPLYQIFKARVGMSTPTREQTKMVGPLDSSFYAYLLLFSDPKQFIAGSTIERTYTLFDNTYGPGGERRGPVPESQHRSLRLKGDYIIVTPSPWGRTVCADLVGRAGNIQVGTYLRMHHVVKALVEDGLL